MENVRIHNTPEESYKYILSLFKEDFIPSSKSGLIFEIIKSASNRMPLFYDMTEPAVERSSFTPWMNAIAHRHYENNYIHDLYLLHELSHIATMRYGVASNWVDFQRNIMLNEFNASFSSEILVYLEFPHIREKTFSHPIYVDRYLPKLRLKPLVEWVSVITQERMRVMQSPNPFDFLEQQIADYAEMNREWCRIWAKDWRIVENHMVNCHTGKDHLSWLTEHSVRLIPFYENAVRYKSAMVPHYEKFGNMLLSAS